MQRSKLGLPSTMVAVGLVLLLVVQDCPDGLVYLVDVYVDTKQPRGGDKGPVARIDAILGQIVDVIIKGLVLVLGLQKRLKVVPMLTDVVYNVGSQSPVRPVRVAGELVADRAEQAVAISLDIAQFQTVWC